MPDKWIAECSPTESNDRFSALTAQDNTTRVSLRVSKGGKPWVVERPASTGCGSEKGSIATKPVKHVVVPDLDVQFAGYDGDYTPVEGAFTNPVGGEKL